MHPQCNSCALWERYIHDSLGATRGWEKHSSLALAEFHRGAGCSYTPEEGHATTLSERLKSVGVTRENFYVVGRCSVDEFAEVCSKAKARALVINSLTATAFTMGEVRTLIDNTKIPLCLAVIQVNKDGQMRG